MNWNAKPEGAAFPPPYPKSQASFLQQALINPLTSTSQGSRNCSGGTLEACMHPPRSNPGSQPLHIRAYETQQTPVSAVNNGAIVASQTSVERITYTNVKGRTQLTHNLQMSSGVTQNAWLNSTVRHPLLPHSGAAVPNRAGFGDHTPSVQTQQGQLVTSDTYAMALQVVPSKSVRVPVTYQGNQGLPPAFSERQVDWAQLYTSNGLTFPDYRPLPKQYCFPQQSYLQNPALQKQNPMSSTPLQVKNSPNAVLSLQSQQSTPARSHQYAGPQPDGRCPRPGYDCQYASQPSQSAQHGVRQPPVEVPQSRETHLSERRSDFCRAFQKQWQTPSEKVSMLGNSFNLREHAIVNQPFREPVTSFVDGVQTLAQNNQDKRMDSCNATSNQVLDTTATKENLVKDIEALIEMRRKFSELARKIKIKKDLLMAAGCNKTSSTSRSASAQNSELSLKQNAKIQCEPQATPGTLEIADGKPQRVMDSAVKTNATDEQNLPTNSVPQLEPFEESNYLSKNPLLFKLLLPEDKTQNLLKDARETIQDSQITGNQPNVKTLETSNINDKVSGNSFCLEHKSSTNGLPCQRDSRCMELLATCLSLWKRQPSEPPEEKQCHESRISTAAVGKPKPVDAICGTSPGAVVGNSQKKMVTSQEAALSAVVQNYESSSTTKAAELQIAVVPPLVLTVAKGVTSEDLSETVYPVIKEGSVCSLQGELAESKTLTGSLKVSIASTTSATKIFPLTLEEKQKQSPEDGPEAAPSASWGDGLKPEPAVHAPPGADTAACWAVGDPRQASWEQASWEPAATAPAGAGMLQIATVCSLVEGEMSYDSQIAKMFSSPLKKGEPQKLFPSVHHVISGGQGKERLKCVDANEGLQGEHSLEWVFKKESATDTSCGSSAALQQEIDQTCSSFPLKKVEPQKLSLSVPQVIISSEQEKEQLDKITENHVSFHAEEFVQSTDVLPKTADLSEPLPPPEAAASQCVGAGEGLAAEKCIIKKENETESCHSSAALQQEICLKSGEAPCSYSSQDPASSEVPSDPTPASYLRDQLSELLKEFPYGIETVNAPGGCGGRRAAEHAAGPARPAGETRGEGRELSGQIRITILSSEQMKALFPEQGDRGCDAGSPPQPREETPVSEAGGRCEPRAQAGDGRGRVLPEPEKDDVRCCALGWLSMVYEGVPQCQCQSSEAAAAAGRQAPPEGGVPAADLDSPPNNSLKVPLTPPEKKNRPAREQGKNRKRKSKTVHSTLRAEQELPGQSLSRSDKKLDSLHSHKRKQKLIFHEVNFHSSNKMMRFYGPNSQESLQTKPSALSLQTKPSALSLQTKPSALSLRPLKPKPALATGKDLHGKSGSLIHSIAPEKVKFKVGLSRYKLLEKRKIEQGATVDREIKKKKFDEQEQNKNVGSTPKLCNTLSNPNERASVKEKTVSFEVNFEDLEINVQKNLMKSSNANSKSSGLKDTSCKINRVLISKECLQRQKRREAMGNKGPRNGCAVEKMKNLPVNSECAKPSKLCREIDTCGTSSERHSSSGQASKESLPLTNHEKNLKTHLSEDSKIHSTSRNVKGKAGRKQPDKICIDKIRLDKNLADIKVKFSQMSSQTKAQGKLYLNRVAFKCTEGQSLYLTKLEGSPRKLNKDMEKSQEGKLKSVLPLETSLTKPGMLQFKLCPEGLLDGRTAQEQECKASAGREHAPVQVSGIKSTKEAWLKSVPLEKRLQEAKQEIDDSVLPSPRLSKRSTSADGLQTLQNPAKDSKAMFQTYKRMYMKRSRSFEDSPSK